MIDVNQLRRGRTFLHDGEIYKVTEYSHNKPGRGKATIRVNVRNVRSGANLQLTFTSGDRVEDIRLDKRTVQYLYNDGQFFVFMDNETYEQPHVSPTVFGEDAQWLKENSELDLLFYDREVIDYNLPMTVDLEVAEAEVAIAGDTATGATKDVTTETGAVVRVPLFVNVGDVIRVNTQTGEYITRA
ncbi:MAG: elongation factor P [Candidatus Promineifilaceae bacterium]